MKTLSYADLTRLLKTKEISCYNIYNSDIAVSTYYSTQYYLRYPHDTMDNDQILTKFFFDIEVHADVSDDTISDFISEANFPINAVTLCTDKEKIFRTYYLLLDTNFQQFGITTDSTFDMNLLIKQHIEEFKKVMISEKYIDDSFGIEITIFNDEKQLILEFWKELHRIDPDILTGWNCIRQDQSIWLPTRIIEIGNLNQGTTIYRYGIINELEKTPKQPEYKITLKSGHTIICSENHRFPVHGHSSSELTTSEMMNFNDLSLNLDKHQNTNSNLTYRSFILNNIDYLIKDFNMLNILIKKDYLIEYIEPILESNDRLKYYQRFALCNIDNDDVEYSRVKEFITKEQLIHYITITDILPFKLMKNLSNVNTVKSININKVIEHDVLELLGLLFTYEDTGLLPSYCSYCKTIKSNHLHELQINLKMSNIFRNSKYENINPIKSLDNLHKHICKEEIYHNLTLLLPILYTGLRKHRLNKDMLSQLSLIQFQSFTSGLFRHGCNIYNQVMYLGIIKHSITNKNAHVISELLLWNGIFSIIQPSVSKLTSNIIIDFNDYTLNFIISLIDNLELKEEIQNSSNMVNNDLFIQDEDNVIVPIDKIELTGSSSEMIDVNTTDGLFISNGITTHNSDFFDVPYLYNRTAKLFGDQHVNSIVSKFGHVTVKDKLINIPEFVIADLLYLYKPRDEGGLNLGKKQPQYTLDYISEVVLGLHKLEYKNKNVSLSQLYLNDPITFLLYNIIDVALVFQLDAKQKHVDLYNSIRRIMRTPFSSSIIGSSVTFDNYIYSKLTEEQKYVRYGINNELGRTIEVEQLENYPPLKDKKGIVQKPIRIPNKTYSSYITKFPGAYVKIPSPKIINNGSLVIDLDAASLYPNMILQSNISFDSYRGRVLPPCNYRSLELLENCLCKQQYPNMLFMSIEKLVWDYVDRKDVDKKVQTATMLYYIILMLFDNLYKSGFSAQQIYNPQTNEESIILRTVLVPLLDLLNLIHQDNPGYNKFAYDYLALENINDLKTKYNHIYILENAGEVNSCIRKYDIPQAISIIPNFTFTLAGTLFDKHEVKTGLFTNFLNQLGALRKQYKNARQASPRGSYDYILNDNRQLSVKVIMNTTYGLYGLSSFRYSNHWLAQSITNNGELTIKVAQFIADQYLTFKYGQPNQ